jgi:hypothetical protein
MMSRAKKCLDKHKVVVKQKPDMETVKRARRWLRGAARLLADASNGDSAIEHIAREAASVAVLAEVIIQSEAV